MHDEEFVKLRFWLDAELTQLKIFLALIIGLQMHRAVVWVIVVLYIIFCLLYAASRLAYVESKHKGYLTLPRR